jgi:hypothetical protein
MSVTYLKFGIKSQTREELGYFQTSDFRGKIETNY